MTSGIHRRPFQGRHLVKMIHRSGLQHNLVKWLVAFLCVRKAFCLYQRHLSLSRQVQAGSHRNLSSLQPSSTTLCRTFPSMIPMCFPMLTTSCSCPLLPVVPSDCSVQQDWALRRLLRNLHRQHRVDPSYRPFDERGVAATISKAGYSTAQGPDGLTMLHYRHLSTHGLAFLTELFNLSAAGIDIPAIWKNSVIIPILMAGKPREQGRS